MTGKPDGLRSLAKYSKFSVERIRYHPEADERVIRTITRGILFHMAFWSGPAIQSFAKLTEIIAKLDPDGRIDLVVVDIDGSEALYAVSEFLGGVRGAGETACLRNGSVVATSGVGMNVECFVPNTRSLLEAP